MPRILVTGCRRWRPERLAKQVMHKFRARYRETNVTIVHGAADGIDDTMDRAARAVGFKVEMYCADWRTYGKRAGPLRNQKMVALGADFCIAFHRDIQASKGTLDCVRQCLAAGIPVWLVSCEDIDAVPPKRLTEV